MAKEPARQRVTLSVTTTEVHKGKMLEVDRQEETITLLGPSGESLGTITWESLIDHIYALNDRLPLERPHEETRAHPRASFQAKVSYWTIGGKPIEGYATGIGGGGLFIESVKPLPVGTDLELEFTLPDRPSGRIKARGAVVWVCPKSDQYTFAAGMGIRFTRIADDARQSILALVNTLKRNTPFA